MPDQQTTLRAAMKRLALTRDAFAERLGVSRRALDSWLLPASSGEHRRMPAVVAKVVADLPAAASEEAGEAGGLRSRFTKRGKPHLLSVAQFDRAAARALPGILGGRGVSPASRALAPPSRACAGGRPPARRRRRC